MLDLATITSPVARDLVYQARNRADKLGRSWLGAGWRTRRGSSAWRCGYGLNTAPPTRWCRWARWRDRNGYHQPEFAALARRARAAVAADDTVQQWLRESAPQSGAN